MHACMDVLWFNFIPWFNFISHCFKLIILHLPIRDERLGEKTRSDHVAGNASAARTNEALLQYQKTKGK